MKNFVFLVLLFVASVCSAQRINPATQIKKAPAQNYVLLSDSNFDYQPTLASGLNSLLPDEVVQGSTPPSGAPSGTQGNVYADTNTGTLYVWNGSTWINQGNLNTFANGLTKTGTAVALGGNLTGNTTISGQTQYSLTQSSLLDYIVRTDGTSGTAKSTLDLSIALSQPAYLRVEDATTATTYGQLSVDADGGSLLIQKTASQEAGVYVPSTVEARLQAGTKTIKATNTDLFLENISTATGSETEVVYINPLTGKIGRGAAPSGGGGSTIVNSTPATGVFVTATGSGVTASRSPGSVTITVPTGVQLISARVTGADADNSVGGDLSVLFTGAGIIGNTSVATLHIPATQKIDLSAQLFGAPGTGNPFAVDDDDTVQMQVIGVGSVGSPSITMRAVGLTSNYDNYQLVFNF